MDAEVEQSDGIVYCIESDQLMHQENSDIEELYTLNKIGSSVEELWQPFNPSEAQLSLDTELTWWNRQLILKTKSLNFSRHALREKSP